MLKKLKELFYKYFDYDIIGEYYDYDSRGVAYKKYVKKYYLKRSKNKKGGCK